MSTHLIKLEEAGKHYLHHTFSIEIKQHDFVLVSGTNGSGKTTLINMIIGFIDPDRGAIDKKKLKIGYVPEKVILPPFVDVLDYLKNMARIKRGVVDLSLLRELEIPIDKKIYELSKGNQQKLAMMVAFMGSPELVILDEPLSGLDEMMKQKVSTIIKSFYHKGYSLFVSTHEPHYFSDVTTKKLNL